MSTVKISELQEKSTMEGTEEVLINDSGTSKKFSTQRFLDAKDASETAQDAAELAQGAAETAEANAEDWATKETGTVDGTNYSAKYWATSADVVAVAGKETEIGRLGTADAVADMNTLGTTDIVSDMDALADKAAELGRLGTTDAVSDMNTLGSAAIVADMNTVAGKATEIGLLGTTDAVSDMNALASTTTVSDMNTLATSTNVSNLATCAGDIAAIQGASAAASAAANSAAAAATTYDSFDDRYLGNKSSEPSTDNDGNTLVAGALYFDTANDNMMVWDGSDWITTSSATLTTLDIYKFTSGSAQSVFTGTDDDGNTLVIKPTAEMVTMNGIVLEPTTDYTVTTSTLTLTTDAATDDEVNIYAFGNFELADHYSKTAADARYLNLAGGDLTGDLTTTGNVGIGATSPEATLHVRATNPSIILDDITLGNDRFLAFDVSVPDADTHTISVDQADALAFGEKTNNQDRTLANEWMRITNAGNVGIGNTGPSEKLEVDGSINSTYQSSNFTTGEKRGFIDCFQAGDLTRMGAVSGSTTDAMEVAIYTSVSGSTGGSEAMRIDSDGNVGIGTDNPGYLLDVGSNISPGTIRVTNNVYDSWILQKRRSDDTQICGIKEVNSGDLAFYTGSPTSSERVRISDGGISFGGDTTTGDSRYLDDYEEGTWTPTYNSTGSISNAVGTYVKIGKIVQLKYYFNTSGIPLTSNRTIGGLPYDAEDAFSYTSVENTGIAFGDDAKFVTYVSQSQTLVIVRDAPLHGATSSDDTFRGSITYTST